MFAKKFHWYSIKITRFPMYADNVLSVEDLIVPIRNQERIVDVVFMEKLARRCYSHQDECDDRIRVDVISYLGHFSRSK